MRGTRWAALAGIVSAAAVLAVAELLAVFVQGRGSPVFAIGDWVIDLVPPFVKDLVIALFGTADKVVLLLVLGLLVAVLAAAAGVLQRRKPPLGLIVLAVVSGIAILAVTTRPDAAGTDAVPTVAGMLVGASFLHRATLRLADWERSQAGADVPRAPAATRVPAATGARAVTRAPAGPASKDRRRFLTLVLVAGAASVVVGAGARAFNAAASAVSDLRTRLALPAPAVPAPPIPPSATLDVPGITTLVTPNDSFYRIDTAIQVPAIDPGEWTLRVTGMVEREVEISFEELLAKPLVEHLVTLACVSNEVGGTLIGNAAWLGYPIRDLLAEAGPLAGADMVLSRSEDGFTAGTPLDVLRDDDVQALLAVGMNGEPLPLQHGFPVRMVVPGLYGYVSATKWVVELRVTRFADEKAYWSTRGWTERGPIKLSSRVDTPRRGANLTAGTVPIAGVAWAQNIGVAGVEVRIDGGDWNPARLATAISADTWVQWVYEWDATSGAHRIEVRATDANGLRQTGDEAPPAPDGATGWHAIDVQVS